MAEIDETVSNALERAESPAESGLFSTVAALVAVVATIMALCNIKDGNIAQAMTQAQTRSVDAWAYYQAKSMKQNLAESVLDEILLQREMNANLSAEARVLLQKKVSTYEETVKRYEKEKEAIHQEAEEYQKEYDRLNMRDDQFDMADAGFSISIALLGISALTKKRWLVAVALMFGSFGAVLGLAGFLGWNVHPEVIAKFLS
jgi:hypothetical protein